MSNSILKNFNLEKKLCHVGDNLEFFNQVSLRHLGDVSADLKQLKLLKSDLGEWLSESQNHRLDLAVEKLERSIDNIKTTNLYFAVTDILNFAETVSHAYEQKVEIEVTHSGLLLDFKQYSQLQSLLEFVVISVVEKLPPNTITTKFTVSFYIALDQVCMDISSSTSCSDFTLDIEKRIAQIEGDFVCQSIANERGLFNLLIKTTRQPHYSSLLLIEVADLRFAVNQENIIGVVRSEIVQNNFILFKGENVPLINLKEFLDITDQDSNSKRLNFANIFGDEQEKENLQSIVLFNIANSKCGFIVDNIIENGEFLVYPNHQILAKSGYYMGAIEQKDHGLLLVIDPVALVDVYDKNKGATQGKISNSHNICEMINYLLDFEEKIEKISNQSHLEESGIVVLEDSPLFRKLIVKKLKDEENSVFAFDDSSLALEYLKQNPQLNIIIADFNIPDIDGILFAQKCKAIRDSINIISLVTAIESAEIKNRKLDDLFYAFVAKTDQEKIIKIVNSILINEIEYNK